VKVGGCQGEVFWKVKVGGCQGEVFWKVKVGVCSDLRRHEESLLPRVQIIFCWFIKPI
jgi:hypothetical protein